jgi:hypothetical protein
MEIAKQQDRFIPITEGFNRLGLKKTAGYGLVATGKLRIIKLGRKSVCAESELNTLICSILESGSTSIVTEEQAASRAAAAEAKNAANNKSKPKAVKTRLSKSQQARGA